MTMVKNRETPVQLDRRKKSKKRQNYGYIVAWRIGILIAFIGLWWIGSALYTGATVVLPSPLRVLNATAELVFSGEFWPNLGSTLSATFIALVLSAVIGIIVGIGLALLPKVEAVLDVYIDALNAAPRIAFAPVLVVLFGLDQLPKIILGFTVAVFMILSSARSGVHAVDDDVHRSMVVMGASKVQIFWKALLPGATPAIANGLRLGLIWSLLGVIAMEMISSRAGVGQLIAEYSSYMRLDIVYGLIIILVIIASVLNVGVRSVERYLLKWQQGSEIQ